MVREYERLRHIKTGRYGAAILIQASGRLAMMKTIDIGRLDSVARKEVLEEVKVLATLRHAHIAAVNECFIEGGYLCLVIQYVEGGHAGGQIERARRAAVELGDAQVLRWFTQALLGLKYMHDRSVIHRDLRTRRLLLTSAGNVVLSCAAITPLLRDSLSKERPDLEALRYMSPELVAGKEHTFASDMWAFGAILYELSSLSPPYDNQHPRGLAEVIIAGPPRSLPAKCSKIVRNLTSALMKRPPEERFTTTELLCHPDIQEKVVNLFDAEPAFVPGATQSFPSKSTQVVGGTPRKGGFGPILLQSPAGTPRGLRRVGEQVTGVKCGSLGMSGTIKLSTPKQKGSTAMSTTPGVVAGTPEGRASKVSTEVGGNVGGVEETKQLTAELADEHAKLYAGIMVQTALEELNFSSSRLVEEDVPFDRWSLPTCVDNVSGATWDINKEVCRNESKTVRGWDMAPPEHHREFPRFQS